MTLADKYQLISRIGYIAAGLFLLAALILFFVFNIRKIICDLSGITERHAVNRIREKSNTKSDKLTSSSAKIRQLSITNKIVTNGLQHKGMAPSPSTENDDTMVLGTIDDTEVLNTEETTLLNDITENSDTIVLAQNAVTEELSGKKNPYYQKPAEDRTSKVGNFTILESIVIIHSDIVIDI